MTLPDPLPANWNERWQVDNTVKFSASDQDNVESTVNALLDEVPDKYTKPDTGIPEADLSSGVLGKLGTINGVSVSGVAQAGYVPVAINSGAASWQAQSGGGGGGGGSTATAGVVFPEQYGASGNGSADDTAALQQWLTGIVEGHRKGVLTSGANYRITAPLTISTPAGLMWSIDGQGATITQAATSGPILRFTRGGMHGCSIDNITWDYATQQAATNSTITFDSTVQDLSESFFHNVFSNFTFQPKCGRGITTVTAGGHDNPVWGCRFFNIRGNQNTGSVIRLEAVSGVPNNQFAFIYQHRANCTEPIVYLTLQQNCLISNFESNASTRGPVIDIRDSAGVQLHTVRDELGSYAAGDSVFNFANCNNVSIDNWQLQQDSTAGLAHSLFNASNGTSISLGGGTIYNYNEPQQGGALTVLAMDSTSTHTRFENVIRPANVLLYSGGTGGPRTATNITMPNTLIQTTLGPAPSGGSSTSSTLQLATLKPTLIAMGDSLIDYGVAPYDSVNKVDTHLGSEAQGHGPLDYVFLANLMNNSKLDILGACATSGAEISQIISNWKATVIAAKPTYCLIYSGMGNNMINGTYNTAALTAFEGLVSDLLANGTTPVLATIVPAAYITISQAQLANYNTFVSRLATKYGIPLLDFYNVLVNPADGEYRDSPVFYDQDGIHFAPYGSRETANVISDWIATLPGQGQKGTLAGYNANITGQLNNPLLDGTIGANNPTGWTTSGVTKALAAATFPSGTFVPGNKFTITATGSGLGYALGSAQTVSAGQAWELSFIVTTNPGAMTGRTSGPGWGLQLRDQSANVKHQWGTTDTGMAMPLTVTNKIFHARGVVGSGVTSLTPELFVYGTGSVLTFQQLTLRIPARMSPALS